MALVPSESGSPDRTGPIGITETPASRSLQGAPVRDRRCVAECGAHRDEFCCRLALTILLIERSCHLEGLFEAGPRRIAGPGMGFFDAEFEQVFAPRGACLEEKATVRLETLR